jgi:class 3 adenylate cyclase/tetratricopeptide (TPR) repeat protein
MKPCPTCSTRNPSVNLFCGHCGHPFGQPSASSTKSAPFEEKIGPRQRILSDGLIKTIVDRQRMVDGERKQVTVMFCDMVRYTPMVDRIGAEKTYEKMDDVYEILLRCVSNHEGIVNEMTGDGIIALFGAPVALEDAPQKALCAALAIHKQIFRFNDKKGDTTLIKMRIGLHCGPVIVGLMGNDSRLEFKAVGGTVNLAARMEQLAVPGTTYVSEAVYKLTRNLFNFEPLGKRAVKGKKEKMAIFRLLSMKDAVYRPRPGFERMLYSKMVGREKELSRLQLQVMKVINGQGSIVNVIGEPGIGKSRLLAELKNREEFGRITLIEGRAVSIGKNFSFHPIVDLLKQWARIKDWDSDAQAIRKLERAIGFFCPDDLTEVVPFVATLLGINLYGSYQKRLAGIHGDALKQVIYKNVARLLSGVAAFSPVVLISEDLHWADSSTVDLLEYLFRLAERQRILFVNVFRPDEGDVGQRVTRTVTEKLSAYHVEIVLTPLDKGMSQGILENMLGTGTIDHALCKRIVQRCGGNPFFIEEVVRSLIDEDALELRNGRYQATEKIGRMIIPQTVGDLLMSRIDRLEEQTRDVVKTASVIGRSFFLRIIETVLDSMDDIDGRLDYLTRIQLLSVRKRIGEIEYLFRHALAREAVYGSILKQQRRSLHLKIAKSIHKIFGNKLNEFYGMMAYHYSQGGDVEKTEAFLIKAGNEAMRTSASAEALYFFQEALTLYMNKYGNAADSKKVTLLEKNIALAFFNKGNYDHAVKRLDLVLNYYGVTSPRLMMLSLVRLVYDFGILVISLYLPLMKFNHQPSTTDRDVLALCLLRAKALGVTHPRRFFLESIHTARRMARFDLTTIDSGIAFYAGTSVVISWAGMGFRLSRKILDFCRARLKETDSKSVLFFRMCELACNCVASGIRIEPYDQTLVDQNLKIGEIYPAVLYIFHHGHRHLTAGRLQDAQDMRERLEGIVDEYDNDFARTVNYELGVKILITTKRINEAIVRLNEGLDFVATLGMGMFVHLFYAMLARLQVMSGKLSSARSSLLQAESQLPLAKGMPYYHSQYLISQSLCDLYQLEHTFRCHPGKPAGDQIKNAAQSIRKMVTNARKVVCDLPEALKIRGIFLWMVDKQEKALQCWHHSVSLCEQLEARVELSRVLLVVGHRLAESDSRHDEFRGRGAGELIQDARALFETLALTGDLDELERDCGFH